MKVEKNVSMHSHTLELPCKRQIVTDTKSLNASHIVIYVADSTKNKIRAVSDWKLRKSTKLPQNFTSSYQNKSKVDQVIDKIFVKRGDSLNKCIY